MQPKNFSLKCNNHVSKSSNLCWIVTNQPLLTCFVLVCLVKQEVARFRIFDAPSPQVGLVVGWAGARDLIPGSPTPAVSWIGNAQTFQLFCFSHQMSECPDTLHAVLSCLRVSTFENVWPHWLHSKLLLSAGLVMLTLSTSCVYFLIWMFEFMILSVLSSCAFSES